MKLKLTLSSMLFIAILVGYGQTDQSRKIKENSTQPEEGLIKVTIMYPFEEGNTFDMDYYKSTHMPMVAKLLGSNLVKYTIEKGVASGIPNKPKPYMAIGAFYVKNLSDYETAIASKRDAIRADFPNYTNTFPVILISEVVE